ncbi:MAG: TraI domain-containing protein, partial [Gemmatimonadota bacterium]
MPQIHIPTLTVGDRIEDTFLVLDVETRSLESGDQYTFLRLGNSTGGIATEPFWPARSHEIAGVRKGHPVRILGEVGTYRQKKQLKVNSIRVIPKDSVEISQLLPTVGPVERFWDTVDGWRLDIAKPRLRNVLDLFFEDGDFRHKFERCPASINGHHAKLGGLLKHTTEVAAIARTIARTSGADLDV